ncbi:lamin tail domain-containing protein [Actinosynnema sp. NPDC050436]|uniref:lamin tail domain-containing protein n=1 Tax=Actinosynnema sp. NPDC050436 TaxID=3155659 RepID=UPI0033D92193
MRRFLSSAAILAVLTATATTGGIALAAPDSDGVAPMVSSSLVVNEVATRGPSGQLDEFIEVLNVSNQYIDLANFEVRVYSPSNVLLAAIDFLPGMVLEPRGNAGSVVVLTGTQFSGTVDVGALVQPISLTGQGIPDTGGVGVFTQAGVRVDGVAFSVPVTATREGTATRPQTIVPPGIDPLLAVSSARDVISTDTDNNQRDFSLHVRTPGALN